GVGRGGSGVWSWGQGVPGEVPGRRQKGKGHTGSLRISGRGTCRNAAITQRSAGGTHTISDPRSRPRTIAAPTASGVVARGAGSSPAVIFVCTNPGRTIITDAPDPASASPRPWKKASRPAFVDP